ncbi:hypothetical protein [Rhizobium hainanense]|nr:hypothetical protein [Rhizobium hainanense]
MFFVALRDAVLARLGSDHPCFPIVERAADDAGGIDATLAVQEALNALGGELATVLMGDVHEALRQNPQAILDRWRPNGAKQ